MAKLLTPLAERLGEAPALIDEFGETSWVDLEQRTNRLVHALRDAGLRTGDTFAVTETFHALLPQVP